MPGRRFNNSFWMRVVVVAAVGGVSFSFPLSPSLLLWASLSLFPSLLTGRSNQNKNTNTRHWEVKIARCFFQTGEARPLSAPKARLLITGRLPLSFPTPLFFHLTPPYPAPPSARPLKACSRWFAEENPRGRLRERKREEWRTEARWQADTCCCCSSVDSPCQRWSSPLCKEVSLWAAGETKLFLSACKSVNLLIVEARRDFYFYFPLKSKSFQTEADGLKGDNRCCTSIPWLY